MSGAMSIGLFVTFVRYFDRFFNPIATLARELHTVQEAFTSAERVSAFLKHKLEDSSLGPSGSLRPALLKGEIEFKDVGMRYTTQEDSPEEVERAPWALKDLSFKIRPGEKIGLVGRTGCGKSSTVALLARLYPFQKGEILLDGRPIQEYDRHWLRGQLGFVSQEVVIFRASLRENLTTGREVSDRRILECCQETGLLSVMQDNGLTLESEILEAGANLSVGERQLLALTRILIMDPAIMIMDEATSNIDSHFEKLIHTAVSRAMQGRTCLFIAHRLATLAECDRLLVFDKGGLVEEGAHQNLLERRSFFYKLQNAQEGLV